MRDIPLNVLLAFPSPNYVNPDTRGPALLIVNSIFLVLCTFFVILRFYTRIHLMRTFGWDDASLLIGFIFAVGLAANVMLANNLYYWDRHIYDIPLMAASHLGKSAMSAKLLFTAAVTFIRYALLLFYFRLVTSTGLRHFKWAIHGTVWFNFLIFIVFSFLSVFQCWPISAYWKLGQASKCIDEGKVTLAAGIVNCIADLLVTALPIPIILRLQMPLPQRMGVAFLLSLGFIVTIAGIVRTYFIWKALMSSYDQTWYAYPLWISAAVEVQLAVITACIPPLRPLADIYFPGFSNPLTKITSKLSSMRSGSKNSTPAHSANQTKPLSSLDAQVSPAVEAYNPIDVEKLQSQEHAPVVSSKRHSANAKSPKKLNWQIMRQHSIEVSRDWLPAQVTDGDTPGSSTWAKSPVTSSTTTPSNKRFSNLFTRFWGTNSSNTGTGSVSTDNPTIQNPLSPQLQHHPFRHEPTIAPPNNHSKPLQRPSTAAAHAPEQSLAWPLREPANETSGVEGIPRRTLSDGAYHRVEIRGNPFTRSKKKPEAIEISNSDDKGPLSGHSRATTLTTQWA